MNIANSISQSIKTNSIVTIECIKEDMDRLLGEVSYEADYYEVSDTNEGVKICGTDYDGDEFQLNVIFV